MHAKEVEQDHYNCHDCGESFEGEPNEYEVVNIYSLYQNEPSLMSAEDLRDVIGEYLVTKYDCEGCGEISEDSVTKYDVAWRCRACNTVHFDEDIAEDCCR